MTPAKHDPSPADWWREAVVYQIYPRSFADGNGDGIGDLAGITGRVGYLADLGVDAVWLSPFYPSALADGGYDVDDYRDVDPRLGTLADIDALIAALHGAGIKVIVDIVPNHTSDRHAWFREALATGRGSDARGRYHFREGRGDDGASPPNGWTSIFGGPAWTRVVEPDGTPGQWYFHYFAAEQPDLNWDRRDVRDDFLRTIRFWADRGVDGFRIDVAFMLTKDLDPAHDALPDVHGTEQMFPEGHHPLFDRDDVQDVYAEWRRVFDDYDPPRTAVAEAWVPAHRRVRYASPASLGQAFNFDLLEAGFDAVAFREIIERNVADATASGTSSTWVFSNHDVVRHATRYGLPGPAGDDGGDWLRSGGDPAAVDAARGLRRARAATLLMLALPGSAYLYQGEELGLQEVGSIPAAERQDPVFFRSRGADVGRDGCRVPLPWTSTGPSFGFGAGGAHLPQPSWFARYAVDVEEADPDSTLWFYRNALRARREITGVFAWEDGSPGVLRFSRGDEWRIVANFGEAPVALPQGEVVMTSAPLDAGRLAGEATVWVRR
ncbi:glycoside hydrolase family 13 protein [Propionicicella superfundia]|uniref:glycoside hydrolase family 13 protein n=1 Tax=Propionicicella superfundia TaxID=348582 RepID=UPI000411EBB9|nr:glycoside hydrolase family 13 protein [Propionicicella superfundia]